MSDGPAYITALRRAAASSTTKQVAPAESDGVPLDLKAIEKLSQDRKAPNDKQK
jgi:hypothetical protein